MLKAVKKTASPELLAKLEKFSSNYESSLQSEESMAELFGLLADEYPNLDAPTKNIVKRWLDKIAKILGVKPFTDAEVIDLLNVVSGKVKSGQEITTKDVEIFDNKKTKKSSNESRKQIIGENADLTALNLSYSLNLAKEIERVQKLSFREKIR